LRSGLNAHLLSFGQSYRSAGISRYIGGLIAGLPGFVAPDEATVFIGDRSIPPELARNGLDYVFTHLPTVRPQARILWEQSVAPLEILRRRIRVLHSPAYVAPLVMPCRSVVTVHDLGFVLMPQFFRPGNRMYLATMTRISVRRADRVIADSESTKRDVVRVLKVPSERVEVIPLAVEPIFRPLPPEAVRAFLESNGLPDRYILYVGTLEPRKQLPTLLRAYARARRDGGDLPRLIVGGGKGWGYEGIFRLVEELGIGDSVAFPGFLPLADLPLWYNGASLFAYPSRYEGFGLPVLEAMSCGTPVVTTAASSLPEVAGDAACYVQPGDVDGLAQALTSLLQDDNRRDDLARRGLARAALFSPDSVIRRTLAVYRAMGCS
jgi:glycosyltransferase involved in cell wall biosynthesis